MATLFLSRNLREIIYFLFVYKIVRLTLGIYLSIRWRNVLNLCLTHPFDSSKFLSVCNNFEFWSLLTIGCKNLCRWFHIFWSFWTTSQIYTSGSTARDWKAVLEKRIVGLHFLLFTMYVTVTTSVLKCGV